jgi:hypothetical protein
MYGFNVYFGDLELVTGMEKLSRAKTMEKVSIKIFKTGNS